MNVQKQVLLARPHPFIVAEMAPFLTQLGYAPVRLHSVEELAAAPSAAGAVISLAVGSAIPATAADVFAALRRHHPVVPVLFASLLEFDTARGVLAALAEKAGISARIIGVDSGNSGGGDLGKPDTFFYVAKSDFEAPARRKLVGAMLRRHFA
jgi:hypothetical protein